MTPTWSSPSGRAVDSAWAIRSVEQLAVGEAGGRVVQGAALRGVDEPRVVERDRGELGEARQRVDLALAPVALELADARPRTPTTRPADMSGTPTTAPTEPTSMLVDRPAHAS